MILASPVIKISTKNHQKSGPAAECAEFGGKTGEGGGFGPEKGGQRGSPAKRILPIDECGGLAWACGRRIRQSSTEFDEYEHYLIRFAPCVNAGCGGLKTLTRDRRTLVGFYAFGLPSMSAGSLQEFGRFFAGVSRNMQEFCLNFAEFAGFCRIFAGI